MHEKKQTVKIWSNLTLDFSSEISLVIKATVIQRIGDLLCLFYSISNLKYPWGWLSKADVHSYLQAEYRCSALSESEEPIDAPKKSGQETFGPGTLKSGLLLQQVTLAQLIFCTCKSWQVMFICRKGVCKAQLANAYKVLCRDPAQPLLGA